MGVPTFYKWLQYNYPSVITSADLSSLILIDNLYIDMNGLIHTFFNNAQTDSSLSSFDIIFQSLFDYLFSLITIATPTNLLFLAIDGVAPKAKMNQQRSRRYKIENKDTCEKIYQLKSKGLSEREIFKTHKLFDSNCISPGTQFQELLTIKMKEFINNISDYLDKYIELNNGGKAYKKVKIIFSDSTVPGEGEHKIFNYIREERIHNSNFANSRHIIYGVDADLIMLSLLTHEQNFQIIRPKNIFAKTVSCEFDIINIRTLRKYFHIEFEDLILKYNYDFERIIDDFVLICIFVGNDFLPNVPLLHIYQGAVSELIYLYKKCGKYFSNDKSNVWYISNDNGSINIKHLHMFLEKLSQVNKQKMNEIRSKTLSNDEFKEERNTYYSSKLHLSLVNDELIKNISTSYLITFCWIYQYYYNGIPSWEWYYPFHYSPFISDLTIYSNDFIYPIFDHSTPIRPFEQLLAILPPWSSHCLPFQLGQLMTSIESPLIDLYPNKVKHDDNNHKYTWMGVNLIPFSDNKRIKREVWNVINNKDNFDKHDLQRNQFMQNYLIIGKEWSIMKTNGNCKLKQTNRSKIIMNSNNEYNDEDNNVTLKIGDTQKYCGDEAKKRIDKYVIFDNDNLIEDLFENEDEFLKFISLEFNEGKTFLKNKRKKE